MDCRVKGKCFYVTAALAASTLNARLRQGTQPHMTAHGCVSNVGAMSHYLGMMTSPMILHLWSSYGQVSCHLSWRNRSVSRQQQQVTGLWVVSSSAGCPRLMDYRVLIVGVPSHQYLLGAVLWQMSIIVPAMLAVISYYMQ